MAENERAATRERAAVKAALEVLRTVPRCRSGDPIAWTEDHAAELGAAAAKLEPLLPLLLWAVATYIDRCHFEGVPSGPAAFVKGRDQNRSAEEFLRRELVPGWTHLTTSSEPPMPGTEPVAERISSWSNESVRDGLEVVLDAAVDGMDADTSGADANVELLTTREFAERVGEKPSTVKGWLHRYPGPPRVKVEGKRGRFNMYSRHVLEAVHRHYRPDAP